MLHFQKVQTFFFLCVLFVCPSKTAITWLRCLPIEDRCQNLLVNPSHLNFYPTILSQCQWSCTERFKKAFWNFLDLAHISHLKLGSTQYSSRGYTHLQEYHWCQCQWQDYNIYIDFINLSTLLNLKDFINIFLIEILKPSIEQSKMHIAHHFFDVKMFRRSYIQFKPIYLAGPWIFAKLLKTQNIHSASAWQQSHNLFLYTLYIYITKGKPWISFYFVQKWGTKSHSDFSERWWVRLIWFKFCFIKCLSFIFLAKWKKNI